MLIVNRLNYILTGFNYYLTKYLAQQHFFYNEILAIQYYAVYIYDNAFNYCFVSERLFSHFKWTVLSLTIVDSFAGSWTVFHQWTGRFQEILVLGTAELILIKINDIFVNSLWILLFWALKLFFVCLFLVYF